MVNVSLELLEDDQVAHDFVVHDLVCRINESTGGEADPNMWTIEPPIWEQEHHTQEWLVRTFLIPKDPLGVKQIAHMFGVDPALIANPAGSSTFLTNTSVVAKPLTYEELMKTVDDLTRPR